MENATETAMMMVEQGGNDKNEEHHQQQVQEDAGVAKTTTTKPEDENETYLDECEWQTEFKEILDDIDHAGEFAVGTKLNDDLPAMQPKIVIDGERLSFPLTTMQAEKLRSVATKAPYGKGSETVTDENVRKAWQIDAELVHFLDDDDQSWSKCLSSVVQKVGASLGLKAYQLQNVRANLYKMLLYETGGHFVKHRDTEKEAGMFGTLVIQLPSKFQGGALAVQHGNETKTFDFSATSEDGFFATAFFADCEHELQAVSAGWRLCLVYNLVLSTPSQQTELPSATSLTAQAKLLRKLARHWPLVCTSKFHGYLLEHKYTEANLHFGNLKGRDKDVVDLLRGACDENGDRLYAVSLLLMEKWETGTAACDSYRHYDRDDGPHIMDYVNDSNVSANHWVGPDDRVISNCKLTFNPECHLLLDAEEDVDELFDQDPDHEEYEGYMGNYGPTLEYWYYRCAVVFWPKSHHFEIAAMAGIPFLASCLLSASDKEAPLLAAKAMDCLDKGKIEVSDELLQGLLQVANPEFMTKALARATLISTESRATTLVLILEKMFSTALKEAIFQILKATARDLSRTKSCVAFLEKLQCSQFLAKDLSMEAQDVILDTVLSNRLALVQSSSCETIGKLAYRSKSHLEQFIDALIEHGSPSKIKSMAASLIALEKKATEKDCIRRLGKHRVVQLQTATEGGVPAFSWRQPSANFQGSQAPLVNSFLHSDKQSSVFHGFNGIGHARNWSAKYFSRHSGYSATAVPGGIGRSAHVKVTKTKDFHRALTKKYEENVAELKQLSSFFGFEAVGEILGPTTNNKRSSETITNGDLQKRAKQGEKENPICMD